MACPIGRAGYGVGMKADVSFARFRGLEARGVLECIDVLEHPERLREGLWFMVAEFDSSYGDGTAMAWRFAEHGPVEPTEPTEPASADWRGPSARSWRSSVSEREYVASVSEVLNMIGTGALTQVNLCRVLAAALPADDGEPDARALADRLAAGNPAPYAGAIHVPEASGVEPVWVVSASPELYLSLADGVLSSGPIKGTAPTADQLTEKDRTENLLVAAAVGEELAAVCVPGSVDIVDRLRVEQHPGLVHLVSTVTGRLDPELARADDLWLRILEATSAPASVVGVPRGTAMTAIEILEPEPRGAYCGAFGWIDGDAGTAELAAAIRTFWWDGEDEMLRFGTGAGITGESDPMREWQETELKAKRLIALASAQ